MFAAVSGKLLPCTSLVITAHGPHYRCRMTEDLTRTQSDAQQVDESRAEKVTEKPMPCCK